jgi:hypothetical protein
MKGKRPGSRSVCLDHERAPAASGGWERLLLLSDSDADHNRVRIAA